MPGESIETQPAQIPHTRRPYDCWDVCTQTATAAGRREGRDLRKVTLKRSFGGARDESVGANSTRFDRRAPCTGSSGMRRRLEMSPKPDSARTATARIQAARSLLFVPGNRPDRFERAKASEADLVICDLEDSVGGDHKDLARSCVAEWLSDGGGALVRLNAAHTPDFSADLDVLKGLPGVLGLVLPKAEPAALLALSDRIDCDVPVVALIETAVGVQHAGTIAATPGVVRLAFGAIDFSLDVGSAEDEVALLFARSSLVVSSRAARIAAPVDGVTLNLDNSDVARNDAFRVRQLGFGGKLCIHPHQVAAVNSAFAPTGEEVDWARLVVAATTGSGASRVGHSMIDRAVIERAQRILRWAAP